MSQSTSTSSTVELSAALMTYSARLGRAVSRTTSGIPAATMRLLSQLDELGPVGISSLAQSDRCSQPTMSTAVQGLVDKGWASKSPNPSDARSWLVELTEAGAAVLAQARHRHGTVVAERLAADPCHDIDDLQRAVTLLRHLLDPEPEQGTRDL